MYNKSVVLGKLPVHMVDFAGYPSSRMNNCILIRRFMFRYILLMVIFCPIGPDVVLREYGC
jgi:hypothetical protein